MVTQAVLPELDEYIDEIKNIWDSHWLTNMGPKHNELQSLLCEALDITALSLFSNGHMALELLLQAFDLQQGGEVITTPFTFVSTTHAIVRNGLQPVFCDINDKDYTMDVRQIENLITDKTVAILPVHVYGNICDVEAIDKIAKRYNLKVIYDAAHAFGVTYRGKGIGNYGDAAMYSFHATKVFNTIEGGAVAFHNEDIGKKLYQLKNFGIKNQEEVDGIGANAKMNEFQAAMGICNLRHYGENREKRKRCVELYSQRLSGKSGIIIQDEHKSVYSNYAYYPVFFDKECGISRDVVYQKLMENNIFPRKYFYPLTSEASCYISRFDIQQTPVAKRVAEGILTLPLYADLELSVIDEICDIILNIRESY